MQILVFGAGSLGSLIGGLLADTHDVTLVGRDPHVSAVQEQGLAITGDIEATTQPAADTTVPDSTELAIVTVKSYDTDAAARTLRAADPDTVLSLQNGLGNEETLAESLDGTVLAGTCTYGAQLVAPGVVACTGVGTVTLGARPGGHSREADRIGAACQNAGIETTVTRNMPRKLWEKLAINAGINAITALARVENGALIEGPARDLAARAATETAQVARENGVDLSNERVTDELATVIETTAPNRSSMYQDLEAGQRTEIDGINGAVCERASVPVYVNETLTALIETWERERNLRK